MATPSYSTRAHADPQRGMPRGNVSLERDGKVYWFATDQEAERGARLLDEAEAVITIEGGSPTNPNLGHVIMPQNNIAKPTENDDMAKQQEAREPAAEPDFPEAKWTLRQVSTTPSGAPWYALEQHDEHGPVRTITGTRQEVDAIVDRWKLPVTERPAIEDGDYYRALVGQTVNEAQENGDLRVDDKQIVAKETNEVLANPTDKEIASAMAARSALETERQNILAEAQTPHEVSLDGALKSYVNGRTDAYNNIRNALAETSAVELPKAIEPHELAVVAPLAIEREQSMSLSMV